MSNFESAAEKGWKFDSNSGLGCIRNGGLSEIEVEILRQLDKAKTESLAGQGLLTGAAALLGETKKDKPGIPLKSIEKHALPEVIKEDVPFVSDCGWDLAYIRLEREHVAATVNKYFSKIDQGFCFGIGKDHELSKEELVDFLVSDQSRELTEHETAQLIKVLKNFDKVRDSESDAGCIMTTGITRGDLSAYAQGGEAKHARKNAALEAQRLFDVLDIPREINKK